jgi:hypothetical protein
VPHPAPNSNSHRSPDGFSAASLGPVCSQQNAHNGSCSHCDGVNEPRWTLPFPTGAGLLGVL